LVEGGRQYQLRSEFPNSIQNLLKIPTDCFNGSTERPLDASKPLIVAYHMKKHCHLLLNITVDAIPQETHTAEKVTQLEERLPPHSKELHTLDII